MNESWPCSIVMTLPDTGASITVAPRAAAASASRRVALGLTVLISTHVAPGRSPARTPSGPWAMASRASVSLTMLKMTSAASATWRGDAASFMPAATSGAAFATVRL